MSKWFRIPYRWTPRCICKNIAFIFEDLFIIGPRNVIRWIPVIWMDADFDFAFLLTILEYKFKRMAERQENAQIVTSWGKHAKQLRICQLLCKRMNGDNYSENAARAFGYGTTAWAKEWRAVASQDKEMLGKIIGKYIDHWWD